MQSPKFNKFFFHLLLLHVLPLLVVLSFHKVKIEFEIIEYYDRVYEHKRWTHELHDRHEYHEFNANTAENQWALIRNVNMTFRLFTKDVCALCPLVALPFSYSPAPPPTSVFHPSLPLSIQVASSVHGMFFVRLSHGIVLWLSQTL